MKKLSDKAMRIWLGTFMIILVLFAFPADIIVSWVNTEGVNTTTVRIVTVLFSAAVAMFGFARYSNHAAQTANNPANYTETNQCEEDIFADNSVYETLIVISAILCTGIITAVAIFAIVASSFGMNPWNMIVENIPLDWGIGAVILMVFTYKMARLRKNERDLTVTNSLLSMERKPLVMGTAPAPMPTS